MFDDAEQCWRGSGRCGPSGRAQGRALASVAAPARRRRQLHPDGRPQDSGTRDWLRDYPRLAALGKPSECRPVSPRLDTDADYHAILVWPLAEPFTIYEKYVFAEGGLDVVDASPHGPRNRLGTGLVLPSVDGNRSSQAPLVVAWWTML